MPPAPWSPRPRMRSLSVTTMSRTPGWPALRSISGMWSMSSGVIHTPRVPPHDVAVLTAGTPNRRRVDDRGKLLEVIDQQPVEQASRCGSAALRDRCTAPVRHPFGGDARARGRPAPRSSWSATATGPRSPSAARSSSVKAVSLLIAAQSSSSRPRADTASTGRSPRPDRPALNTLCSLRFPGFR